MNDGMVSHVSEKAALKQQAYILFYARETDAVFGMPPLIHKKLPEPVVSKPRKPAIVVTAEAAATGGDTQEIAEDRFGSTCLR